MWDIFNWEIKNSQIKTKEFTQINNENINIFQLEKELKKVKFWTPILSWVGAIVLSIIASIVFELYVKQFLVIN